MRDATPELQDAVAQAREAVDDIVADLTNTSDRTRWSVIGKMEHEYRAALDALIAAVREADFAAAERYAHTAMQAGGPLLDNLARAYLALLAHLKPPLNNTAAEVKSEINAAVSRPAEARGEPSEAMVEAFIEAFHAGGSATYRDDIRRSLRAALAAQRVKP